MLDGRDPLPERLGKDDMCEDNLDENDKPFRKQPSRAAHRVGLHEDCQGRLRVLLGWKEYMVDRWDTYRESAPMRGRRSSSP